MSAPTTPAAVPAAGLTLDDLHRINDLADLLTGAIVDGDIRVRITPGSADDHLDPCVECEPDPPSGIRVPGDVVVHWGHARPVYADPVCRGHLRRFLRIHVRHDQAQPVVDIPAQVAS